MLSRRRRHTRCGRDRSSDVCSSDHGQVTVAIAGSLPARQFVADGDLPVVVGGRAGRFLARLTGAHDPALRIESLERKSVVQGKLGLAGLYMMSFRKATSASRTTCTS